MEYVAVTGEARLCVCGKPLGQFKNGKPHRTCGAMSCQRRYASDCARRVMAEGAGSCVDCGAKLRWRGPTRCRVCAGIARRDNPSVLAHIGRGQCTDCGCPVTAKATRCRRCAGKQRVKPPELKFKSPQRPSASCISCGASVWRGTQRCRACHVSLVGSGAKEKICVGCGATFRRTRKVGDKGLYCSRGCAYSHQHEWNHKQEKKPAFSRVFFPSCQNCSSAFTARRKGVQCCSEACADALLAAKGEAHLARLRAKSAALRAATKLTCKCCGRSFKPKSNLREKYCGKTCAARTARQTESAKAAKQAAKALRRMRRQMSTVELFSATRVFERDGWQCQGCGCDTPKDLRGKNVDNSPELDHVVPLAKGGEHSMRNAQTLCRVCNILKADDDMESFIIKYLGAASKFRFSAKNTGQIGRAHV